MSHSLSRLAGLLVVSALAGCAATHPPQANFVRVVIVKYKEPFPDERKREFLSDIGTQLVLLPMVKGLHLGSPVPLSKREGVTMTIEDYDMAFVVLFVDDRGLQDFLDHPVTVAFNEKWTPFLDVRVMAFRP